MNCEEIKQKLNIRTLLESFGRFPVKENKRTAFYFALDRNEKTPSLSVDFINNKAFDFGNGKNYDVISVVQQINQCSVSEALKYLETITSYSAPIQKESDQKNYKILRSGDIKHPALIEYLKSRKVYEQKELVKEIHYEVGGKKYFGIGFFNNSNGVEIRNKYSKICLGAKDVTLINNVLNSEKAIAVFEGFFDFLTYCNLEKNSVCDYLILNSTSMLFKVVEKLNEYNKISIFLDNDDNGKLTKDILLLKYRNVVDYSHIYKNFVDLNEWYNVRE